MHATNSFSLSLSQLQKCYNTSLSSPLLPIALDGGGVVVVWLWHWWREGCGLGGLWVLWHGFLLGSRTSFDPPSLHIWFHDEKARKDFLENLSSCGIHSKHHVVLSNFSNTTLPTVIHSRGWESLCEIPVRCPTVIIQEFYSNMHSFDTSISQFVT